MNPIRLPALLATSLAACLVATSLSAQQPDPSKPSPADGALADYFREETRSLAGAGLRDIHSPEDWKSRRGRLRSQLLEMLGLDPLPEKTDLKAAVTGTVDHPKFTVENLHFQSRPGLYVTGNLYVPKGLSKPAPAVLYVCGHSPVKKDNVSYGNKTAYQHHAIWFASNGYVCLVIDSLQLGEIEGIHHGTYREKMWWWNSRGYTPAGVEAWNCIRSLDYLQSRKEVDGSKLGVTGRSGGGAYSWWLSALDDRIKVAVPVAGITDLHNHVVDGAVEGHCDCMFFVNTHRWDYAAVAALVEPRPLLLTNTDKDSIFPLDGVMRVYWDARRIYGLGVRDEPYRPFKKDLGLQISEGGHVDSPELQVAAFRWFNRHLKGDDAKNDGVSPDNPFDPEQLRVFKQGLPTDAINGRVHDTFVPMAKSPPVPESKEAWASLRDGWMKALNEKVFNGWPDDGGGPLDLKRATAGEYEFTSQPHVRLSVHVGFLAGTRSAERTVLFVGKRPEWPSTQGTAVIVEPRGIGAHAWTGDEKKQTQIRRRFMMVGQTLEGMQAWDVRRAVQAVKAIPACKDLPITLEARGEFATIALYASLFEPDVKELVLHDPPKTHMQGPHFLNVLRFLDVPQALAMSAEHRKVRLHTQSPDDWSFPVQTAKKLGWPNGQLEVVMK